jgi:hypothetical protein
MRGMCTQVGEIMLPREGVVGVKRGKAAAKSAKASARVPSVENEIGGSSTPLGSAIQRHSVARRYRLGKE